MKQYDVKITGMFWYYLRFARLYSKGLLSLTDSYYPAFFARGVCFHAHHLILVWKVGSWRRRYWHEVGHAAGLHHVNERNHIMHPWGFCRGWKGIDEIKAKLSEDDLNYYRNIADFRRP